MCLLLFVADETSRLSKTQPSLGLQKGRRGWNRPAPVDLQPRCQVTPPLDLGAHGSWLRRRPSPNGGCTQCPRLPVETAHECDTPTTDAVSGMHLVATSLRVPVDARSLPKPWVVLSTCRTRSIESCSPPALQCADSAGTCARDAPNQRGEDAPLFGRRSAELHDRVTGVGVKFSIKVAEISGSQR